MTAAKNPTWRVKRTLKAAFESLAFLFRAVNTTHFFKSVTRNTIFDSRNTFTASQKQNTVRLLAKHTLKVSRC